MVQYYDAQSKNNNKRSSRIYTDLDLFFGKKSSDSDINVVNDIQAVKRSVRNLVLLNAYEKPFHPEIASGVRGMLFELMTPVTAVILAKQVEDVITNFEPRVRLVSVRSLPNLDKNAYEISIEFYVVNAPTELVDLTLLLERLR
jgi:phage baseplate assembly protein W|tara:strand:- start:590 stop:1021 length:432 start_codon:yes stop_codon:yes gene_type:complete